ncbi:hypothetical protein [Labrys wisconsinensis]|uniref:Uncharacterized protein n=1 Tax=Labrys wisconsinensis TaxID=425677 RepID=A0ABU0J866_9HYPH|nr:hypothetical protein [Labrys wisconsinensis]MDQ0470472.1 hypothetical protein [Labrys wisconsinensis]
MTGSAQAAVAQTALPAIDPARTASPATMQFAYYYYRVYHRHYHYYRPRYYRPRYYYRPHYYRPCRIVWVKRWNYGRRYYVRRRVCY